MTVRSLTMYADFSSRLAVIRTMQSESFVALVSPIDGYSRVNLELGKLLIAAGRPRDAIAVLQAPLHGSLEASNYYLTQTDLHAILGDAFDRAGETDSALVHYRQVISAWRNADPQFRPRIAALQQRVRALGGTGQHGADSHGRQRASEESAQ